jgi:hypothetical protein
MVHTKIKARVVITKEVHIEFLSILNTGDENIGEL